jgi:hypothetical protein
MSGNTFLPGQLRSRPGWVASFHAAAVKGHHDALGMTTRRLLPVHVSDANAPKHELAEL